MKKQWVGNRRKMFHGEMWENAVRGKGLVKILLDSPCKMVLWKIAKYIWVNIRFMLDWVVGLTEIYFLNI